MMLIYPKQRIHRMTDHTPELVRKRDKSLDSALAGLTNKERARRQEIEQARQALLKSKETYDEDEYAHFTFLIDQIDANLNILELKLQQIGSCIDVQSMVFKRFYELEKKIEANAEIIQPFVESKQTFNSLMKLIKWITGIFVTIAALFASWAALFTDWWNS